MCKKVVSRSRTDEKNWFIVKIGDIYWIPDSIKDYVSQIFETANKLNGIGLTVADEWLASILLAGRSKDLLLLK